jgi:hypothetical protein
MSKEAAEHHRKAASDVQNADKPMLRVGVM